MTKTTFFVPRKIAPSTFVPSTIYMYQLLAGDYQKPMYEIKTPPPIALPGPVYPVITLTSTYGVSQPNLTLPDTC
jgi:hypothetical protein